MTLSSADFSAIWLTLQLASVTTIILLIIGTPIALWLARTQSWWRGRASSTAFQKLCYWWVEHPHAL